MTPTFSCVSFLNALPYVEGLRALPDDLRPRLLLDLPFRCAERLREGLVEAALVPSIELARTPGAVEAGGFGIASRREVRSVVVLSRRPLHEAREIAVDSNSRTSVALLGILLARMHGSRPALLPMPADPEAMLRRCEAALLIGNAALTARREGLRTYDLASMWNELTGMPFVFALWAGRDRGAAGGAAALLERALRLGMEAVPRAAWAAALEIGLGREDVVSYLTRNVHFRLGAEERRSLEAFLALCREDGWVGAGESAPAG